MFRKGFFTSDSWTVNEDGFAIGNNAEGADFLAKILYTCLGDGAAAVTTTGFQVVKKSGLICTVKPFFVSKSGYFAWDAAETDITFTSSASEQIFYVGVRLDLAGNTFEDGVDGRTTFVTATDLAAAKITIPANAVTLTDGMIEDLRYDTAYCGQIDEYRERSLELLAELEQALEDTLAGGVPAHASTHEYGGADALAAADIGQYGVAALDSTGKVLPSTIYAKYDYKTADHTLALVDAGKFINFASESNLTVTIPLNSSVAFPVLTEIEICRFGTGTLTIAATDGATLVSIGLVKTVSDQYGVVVLKQIDANFWLLAGALG